MCGGLRYMFSKTSLINDVGIDFDICGNKKNDVGVGTSRMPKMGKQGCEYKV